MFLDRFKKICLANYKIISLIVPVAILAGGYFYLLKPKYQSLKGISGLIAGNLKISLQAKKEYFENLSDLEEFYDNLNEEDKEKLEQILPFEKDLPNLFVHFESLVKQSGLKLNSIDFSEGSVKEIIKILDVKLSLTGGDYLTFKKFLDRLEKDIKIIDITSISFSKEGYDLKFRTYYLGNF